MVVFGTVFGIDSTLSYKRQLERNSQIIAQEIKEGLYSYSTEDADQAVAKFNKADGDLTALKIKLQEGGQYIPFFFYLPQSDSKLNEASKILKVTSTVTKAISLSGHLFTQLDPDKSKSDSNNNQLIDQTELISRITQGLNSVAKNDLTQLEESNTDLSESIDILKTSKSSSYQDLRNQLLENIPKAQEKVTQIIELYKVLPDILADQDNKNYLILFQNNSELRPAGGFLGSFAASNFKEGKLTSLEFETNIYKLDQPFILKEQIPSPPEYQYLNANMALKDSNYDYDFSQAMPTVMDYYQKETGKKADGVIALDTTLITELLKVIGSIEMSDYGLTITADNFLTDVEYQVEIGYFKDKSNWSENAPKKILAEMMPKIINKTFSGLNDKNQRDKLIKLLSSSLQAKHLLFYSKNSDTQKYLSIKGYTGEIKQTDGDYFFLSEANIGGLKSSLNIDETVTQKINIEANGIVNKTVDIKRTHTGDGSWPDGYNKTYHKIIVPEGSVLKSYRIISGDDLPYGDWNNREQAKVLTADERGKTIFSFWLNTKPGQNSEIELNYQLPPNLIVTGNYQLLIQKQPGVLGSHYQLEITAERKKVYMDNKELASLIKFDLLSDSSLTLTLK